MKFTDLSIHPDLIKAATDSGFVDLTEIQEKCLVPGLEGRDIAGISQTGTGKTVAFLLPILQKIFTEELTGTSALIVTPTRELCIQITEEVKKLSSARPVHVCSIYGGEGYDRQEEELSRNPPIIAATPGRLIDYVKQGKINFDNLKFLVLDEADRMFDMGFIRDVRYIMRHVPNGTQNMLFSATLSYYVMRLASDFMKDPVEVRIESDSVAVEKIDQRLLHLARDEKLAYLVNTILGEKEHKSIVFTNLKTFVPVLVNTLRRYGIAATGLSSLLDQKKRIRLLKNFKLGKYSVLVATDVASRGLDVDDVTHVFNYDLPQDSETYIHRIGRTARAGKSGISISYCSEADYENLPRIERLLGKKIPVQAIDTVMLEFPQGQFTPFVDEGGGRFEEAPERGRRDDGQGGRGRRRKRGGGGRDERRPPRPGSGQPPREQYPRPTVSPEEATTVRGADRAALLRKMDDLSRKPHSRGPAPSGEPREKREGQGPREGREGGRRKRRRPGQGGQNRNGGPRGPGQYRGEKREGNRDGHREGGRRPQGQHRPHGEHRDRGGRGQGQGRRYDRRPRQQPEKKGIISKILGFFKKKKKED